METSSLTNIGDMRKKRHGLFKNYANIFCVGLGRRGDEITNNSDLSLFNFRLLCNIRSPFTRSLNLPCKPLGTTFAHIFLFLDVRIPANALCRPIRTKFLYYITSSHAPGFKYRSSRLRFNRISWIKGNIKLSIVCITMERKTVTSRNIA